MRDPVTTMSSSSWAAAVAALGPGSSGWVVEGCAKAGPAQAAAAKAMKAQPKCSL
jgi:hypothetical protein